MSDMQIVVFNIGGQLFGAEALQIFQIIKYQDVTKIPKMPDFIEGIINYRGTVIPIVNLSKKFDMGEFETTKTKVLLAKIEEKLTGFLVNEVSEIIKINDEDIEPAPIILHNDVNTYLTKVCKHGGKLISIIDLAKVLNDKEMEKLSVNV